MDTKLILHKLGDSEVAQRAVDGYINGTTLCKLSGKEIKHYLDNQTTNAFLDELSRSVGIPTDLLIQKIALGQNNLRGTWVHTHVAIHLAIWCSPAFAVQVTHWVFDWSQQKQMTLDKKIDIELALKCLTNAYDTIDVLVKALENEPNLQGHTGYEIIAEQVREQITGATDFLEGKFR